MTLSTLLLASVLAANTVVNGASLPYRLPRAVRVTTAPDTLTEVFPPPLLGGPFFSEGPLPRILLPEPTLPEKSLPKPEPILEESPLEEITPALEDSTTVKPIPAVESVLTCTGKNQDSPFSYTTSAGAYDIVCGQDYLNGDMSSAPAETFEDCLTACDAESACVSVAYANGICYLKNQLTTAVSNSAVWSAKKQGVKRGLSCVDGTDNGETYQTLNGEFKIICGQEYPGGDLTSTGTASFEACIEACASNDDCVDVSYVNGACYLKQTKTNLVDAGHVWTAERVVEQTPVKAVELSCLNIGDNGKTYTAANGGKYKVECGIDYDGGNLLTVGSETTFQSCMDICDNTPDCIDVSWVWGTCYLKNKLTTFSELSHVWTGRRDDTEESPAPSKDLGSPKSKPGGQDCPGQAFNIGVTNTDTNEYLGRLKLTQGPDWENFGLSIESFVPDADAPATKFKFNQDGYLVDFQIGAKFNFVELGPIREMQFGAAIFSFASGGCKRDATNTDNIICSVAGFEGTEKAVKCSSPLATLKGWSTSTPSLGLSTDGLLRGDCIHVSLTIEQEMCRK